MTVRVETSCAVVPVSRSHHALAATQTIDEIIDAVRPGLAPCVKSALRVSIRHRDGRAGFVPRAAWDRVRPRADTTVVIVAPPQFEAILGAAGLISNFITASLYPVVGSLGIVGTNAVYIGTVAALGGFAVAGANALIPKPPGVGRGGGGSEREDDFAINSWGNELRPGAPFPMPLGRVRMAPVFASLPYSEVLRREQYVRGLLTFGYGRLSISDLRLGDVPFAEVPGLEWEVREGVADDPAHALFPDQWQEETMNVSLERPKSGVPVWHTFRPALDGDKVRVILRFPSGLGRFRQRGGMDVASVSVAAQVSYDDGATWQFVASATYNDAQVIPFWTEIFWSINREASPLCRIALTFAPPQLTEYVGDTMLYAVQTHRPEYPINPPVPMATLAVRVKASQLANGTLDQITGVVQRHAPVWSGSSWTEAPTRNPAGTALWLLQGPANRKPLVDQRVDLDAFADWHEHCADAGLSYDASHTEAVPARDMFDRVAAAGRADLRDSGVAYAPVIDRPSPATRQIGPRNAAAITWTRRFVRTPDALRVSFQNEDRNWENDTLILPWIAHEGPVDLIEEVDLFRGQTNAQRLMREMYRYMQEVTRRRDEWSCEMPNMTEPLARGETVSLLPWGMSEARVHASVVHVEEAFVVLDEPCEISEGLSYGLRWEALAVANGIVEDVSVVTAQVRTRPGRSQRLEVLGAARPDAGQQVVFGPLSEVTEAAIVTAIEPGQDGGRVVRLTNAAPELDPLAAAFDPPAYNPLRGVAAGIPAQTPAAPIIESLTTLLDEDTGATSVLVVVAMPATETAQIGRVFIEHRLAGASSWTQVQIAGGSGAVSLVYADGAEIEVRAAAETVAGTQGPYSNVSTYTVGEDLGAAPATPDISAITAQGGLGAATITLAHSDPNTNRIILYRTDGGATFDAATDEVGRYPISAGTSALVTDGDATRADLLAGLGFAGAAGSDVSQPVALTSGATYRGRLTLSGRTAGDVSVALSGGAGVTSSAFDANGPHLFALTADAGADAVTLSRSADFDGTVSLVLFQQTAQSLPAGPIDYRFAALNDEDRLSAVSGVITVTVT